MRLSLQDYQKTRMHPILAESLWQRMVLSFLMIWQAMRCAMQHSRRKWPVSRWPQIHLSHKKEMIILTRAHRKTQKLKRQVQKIAEEEIAKMPPKEQAAVLHNLEARGIIQTIRPRLPIIGTGEPGPSRT